MNVRGLAASSGGKGKSKGASQADRGRARKSWAERGVSFSSNSTSATADEQHSHPVTNSNHTGGSDGGGASGTSLLAGFPGDDEGGVSAVRLSEDQTEDRAQEEEEMLGVDGFDRIPPWQNDLLDIYRMLGGTQWKNQAGWPTAGVMPLSQALPTHEIYGVQRPYNRLHEVTVVDLAWNGLRGEVAACEGLWHLHSLEVLHLGANRLSGPLPGYELRNLVLLKELHLYRNSLHGRVPVELAECRQLSSLWLFENHLTGPLPDMLFGDLTVLEDLRLNSNRLTGHIPPSLGQCRKMKTLNLQKNVFEGAVPDDIYTGCLKLRDLRLWSNQLTGPLSPEVSCLKQLECLMMQSNLLSWVIPPTLSSCVQLIKLDLSKNNFRGELPPQAFATLQNLDSFNVSNNARLSGVPPLREFKQLPSLTSMDLSGTALEELDQFVLGMKTGRAPHCRVSIEGLGNIKPL